MSQSVTQRRVRLLFLAGMLMVGYPFFPALVAQGPGGGGGGGQQMIHTQNLDPSLRGFRWRSIGPVGQGARIDDLAADEKNPSTYYVGFAVSGLWKTVNNGTTFDPIFDTYGHSIGDLAVAPSNPSILYIGTGEPNNRQSSSFGDGMYKSTDAGATFTHIGLRETQSIARVVVHPTNPDIVWVAAIGHLFGPNPERGIFMTTDGGKTWQHTLRINPDVGATDLVIDRSNPLVLFVATYERRRSAWGFVSGGPGCGIHQSTDGGKTWRKITGNGLPTGVVGRIGLDISRSNPNVIYAQIETGLPPSAAPAAPAAAPPAAGAGRAGAAARGAAPPAPAAGAAGAAQAGGGGRGGPAAPPNPNSSGVWRSADKGKTWTFVSNENNRPMYYSQIRIDPNNENTVYVGGQNAAKSTDGGKTWQDIQQGMGHVDNHAIWIDPLNSNHVMYGNDGGLSVSWDAGDTWEAIRTFGTALPYHVSVDMRRPYWVCTGLQDNGSWCAPSSTRSGGLHTWNWISVGGGDGFQSAIDPTDPNIFYTESQNGNINRYNLNTGESTNIRPAALGGGGRGGGGGGAPGGGGRGNVMPEPPTGTSFAFNWNSPIRLSPHNPHTVLFGGNRLFISRDRGATWMMSEPLGKGIDITQRNLMEKSYSLPGCGGRGGGGGGGGRGGGAAGPTGPPATDCILSKGDGVGGNEFGTIIEIAESPVVPGLLWVGTNDGNVQVSRDNGATFTEVGRNIPGGGAREFHVSGLEASWHDAGTAYVSLDGHYVDDLKPYIFKTTDYGKTWSSVSSNLPVTGCVNSIRQDPVARTLLYATTELGFYVSLNDGQAWHQFMPNLPKGRLDEVVVHPRDNDLVLASHGRGIWIMDDITALQQLATQTAQQDATLFKPRDAVAWKADRKNQTAVPGAKWWQGQTAPPGTAIAYNLRNSVSDARIAITNTATGQAVRTCVGTTQPGMNRFQWTLSGDPDPGGGGGGRGGFGGGGRGAAAEPAPAPAPTGPGSCSPAGGGGGGRGGGGGGGGGGFGGGGVSPGVYKVTLTIGGKEVGSQTFRVLEDVWLNEK